MQNSVLQEVLSWFTGAVTWVTKNLLAAWLFHAPSPDVTGPSSVVLWLQDRLVPLVVFATMLSILVAGLRMGLSGDWRQANDLGESLARAVVVGLITGPAVAIGLSAGDAFATWVLDSAGLTPATAGETALFFVQAFTSAPLLVMIVGAIIVIAQLFQFLFMIARNAMVILLVGQMPLASAATNTETGRQWMRKSVAWLFAFVLYRPVAAVIYAVAIKLFSKADIGSQMIGVALMVMALLALPALMRLMVPATASLGGANPGALAAGAVGAVVATGAAAASMGAGAGGLAGMFGRGGSSGGGGSGAKGPSGSAPSPMSQGGNSFMPQAAASTSGASGAASRATGSGLGQLLSRQTGSAGRDVASQAEAVASDE